ncbi:toll/interleukin-1 receptor domain-containing protein, partial [Vibrio vulnificus]|uniref:toll/interleukin-1 receptor domain-containing protein n=1 Tax=Vibrio vulnificus TaxID=672 RepID=UPI0039B6F6AE
VRCVYFIFLLLGGSKAHDYRTLLFLCSEVSHFVLESKKHNKAFKRDSCRVAFLVCGWFGGESGLRKVCLCGTHPLTRRYTFNQFWRISMSAPKVFISYSHDSQEHKKWVLDLATRLRNSGVDAIIDQWELRPGDDLPHFMETHLADSDYVVMVCTDKYVEKANSGMGGVGYEKMIITADLLSSIDSNKVVPVIRQFGTHNVPTFLKTKLFINFSKDDDYEFSYDELVRTFHGAPLFKKPEIGNNPFTPISDTPPEKTGV